MREPISFIASCRFLSVLMVSCLFVSPGYSQQISAPIPNPSLSFFYGYLLHSNATTAHIEKASITLSNNDTAKAENNIILSPDGTDAVANTLAVPGLLQAIKTHSGNQAANEMNESLFDVETDALVNRFAEMMETDPEEVSNLPLYKFIDDWYGVRYKWGGTDNTGIDCSAFSQKLYGAIYSLNILRTSRQQHRSCEVIKKSEVAVEGDLVFFRVHHLRISHVGVYLANGYFVHASRSKGVMISSLNDKYWHKRYAGCGRIERVNNEAAESDFLQ